MGGACILKCVYKRFYLSDLDPFSLGSISHLPLALQIEGSWLRGDCCLPKFSSLLYLDGALWGWEVECLVSAVNQLL